MASVSSTTQLAHTLSLRRSVCRQAIAVILLLVAAGAWRLSPLHEPEPFTLIVLVIGLAMLLVEVAAAWFEATEADRHADELILSGSVMTTSCTPIGRAVARRTDRLASARSRHHLAEALRWRIRLAQGWTRPSPGYLRASVLPPLSRSQRQVFASDADRIAAIAARIDRDAADPRALIILQRMLTLPPPLDPLRALADEIEDVRVMLRCVERLLESPAQPDTSRLWR